jgi:hypothetical protein
MVEDTIRMAICSPSALAALGPDLRRCGVISKTLPVSVIPSIHVRQRMEFGNSVCLEPHVQGDLRGVSHTSMRGTQTSRSRQHVVGIGNAVV